MTTEDVITFGTIRVVKPPPLPTSLILPLSPSLPLPLLVLPLLLFLDDA